MLTNTIHKVGQTNVFHARIFRDGALAREAYIAGFLATDRWIGETLSELRAA